jgi:hypothetical protein
MRLRLHHVADRLRRVDGASGVEITALRRYGIGLSWSLAPDSVETSPQKPAIAEF